MTDYPADPSVSVPQPNPSGDSPEDRIDAALEDVANRAAEHRACEWSTRDGYEGALITVERSYPVEFVRDETLYLSSAVRDRVRL